MLSGFGIRGKLIAICAVLATFSVVIGLGGLYSANQIVKEYEDVASRNFPNMRSIEEWNSNFRRSRVYLGLIGYSEVTKEEADHFVEEVGKSIKHADQAEDDYNNIPFGPGEKEIYDPAHVEWVAFKAIVDRALDAYKKQDRKLFTKLLLDDMVKANDKFGPKMASLIEFHVKDAANGVREAKEAAKWGKTFSITIMICGFIVAMLLGYFFSRSLSNVLTEIAKSLSAGADEVAAASGQIASSSEQLSASVTEQAAALQETAASIEEMSAMITKNTESASKSKNLSDQSQTSATEGKQIVSNMIKAIEEIHMSNTEMTTEIEKSNQEISDIIKVIGEIGNKTKVINDIVFQTKLLSFNASVEAARAGEHGKGFAVVAEEVGNLAQMSGNASREISSMLDGSIAKVESIVTNTKSKVERLVATGKEKVETGSSIAKRCGEVLDTIVTNVETVNLTVNEISTASQEQDHGVKEVAKAMSQMDQTTQQNSAATQQTASAAEELSAQAETLRGSVIQLMTTVQGAGAAKPVMATAKKEERKPVKAARPAAKKVVSMKSEKKGERSTASAGAEDIPSSSDPRFEDVA